MQREHFGKNKDTSGVAGRTPQRPNHTLGQCVEVPGEPLPRLPLSRSVSWKVAWIALAWSLPCPPSRDICSTGRTWKIEGFRHMHNAQTEEFAEQHSDEHTAPVQRDSGHMSRDTYPECEPQLKSQGVSIPKKQCI